MIQVATFYLFVDLDDLETLAARVRERAARMGLRGTVLLAGEGINGTLTGARGALEAWVAALRLDPRFARLEAKYSSAQPRNPVFHRLKVRLRPEVVTFGKPTVRPAQRTGTRVDAQRWNALLEDPGVVVIDARNRYEIAIGAFPGARNPETDHFREFADYVEAELDPASEPRIAMYCTGGIRCEKASAWLLARGFENVYQLDGGVLGYLATVAENSNRWQGECFVFDQRVSVDARLRQGTHQQCHACRWPLSGADLASPLFEEGISCPHCHAERPAASRMGFRERKRQVRLAAARGTHHVGPAPAGD